MVAPALLPLAIRQRKTDIIKKLFSYINQVLVFADKMISLHAIFPAAILSNFVHNLVNRLQ
jgi:hypothetical protein